MTGKIHSFETFATADGPGIRFVLFMQGCPLRCMYCHNPDSWKMTDGTVVTIDGIMDEILKYRDFLDTSRGGLTVSGGEPLLQREFVTALFARCREEGIHTALDTSGYVTGDMPDGLLDVTDLVLLDLKCADEQLHRELTGVSAEPIQRFARHLSDTGKKMWVRHVLVPGVTDDDALLERLAGFISTLSGVELVEILPFHTMGEYKWDALGYPYRLRGVTPPSPERVQNAIDIMRRHGLAVR